MRVYLAGPIDRVSLEEATDWRTRLKGKLAPPCCVFDPAAAFGAVFRKQEGPPSESALLWIDRVNLTALDSCDVFVLGLEAGQSALMTYVEIGYALAAGKPVLVLSKTPPPIIPRLFEGLCSTSVEDLADRLMRMASRWEDGDVCACGTEQPSCAASC